MRRMLAYLLLSVALIFQGMGSACAYGSMTGHADEHVTGPGATMAIPCADMAKGQLPADGHDLTQDCMQLCMMAARLPGVALSVPPLLLPEPLGLKPLISVADYTQSPPTPPPIA